MTGLGKDKAREQRIQIAALLNEGKNVSEVARILECSRPTIIKVKKLLDDPNESLDTDRREKNGRAEEFTAETKEAILQMREMTGFGPRLIWGLIMREPEKWGILDRSQIPSVGTISDWITEAGMTKKMVGARDNRGWPIDFEDKPGVIAMDEWGPRYIKSERIWLVTAADRYTRLGFGIPMFKSGSIWTWKRAIDIAKDHLLGGAAPTALWIDNGIGMALANGWTSQPVRYALSIGTRVVFNAPHHPWKNGRLENWHWRQEYEYWRLIDSMKTNMKEAIAGFLSYVNWYNVERPHSGLKDADGSRIQNKSPADLASWYMPITMQDISSGHEEPERLDIQRGIIDMVRMVRNNGTIELQDGEMMRVSEVFGGQYLRIRFHLDPQTERQIGEVIWQRGQKKEAVNVATFNHLIDRSRQRGQALITDVRAVDFSIDDNASITGHPPPLLQRRNWTNSSSTKPPPGSANGSTSPTRNEIKKRLFEEMYTLRKSLFYWIGSSDLNEEDKQQLAANIRDEFITTMEMTLLKLE